MNAESGNIVDQSIDLMARLPKDEKPDETKRVIDFDMFLRDLDPADDDEVRGGSNSSPRETKSP